MARCTYKVSRYDRRANRAATVGDFKTLTAARAAVRQDIADGFGRGAQHRIHQECTGLWVCDRKGRCKRKERP